MYITKPHSEWTLLKMSYMWAQTGLKRNWIPSTCVTLCFRFGAPYFTLGSRILGYIMQHSYFFYQPLKCGIDTFDNPSISLNCSETQFSFSNRRVKEDTLSANNSIADYQDLRHYFNFWFLIIFVRLFSARAIPHIHLSTCVEITQYV